MLTSLMGTPKIIVHLVGGLGNQLFQYAFGRHLAEISQAKLYLDISGYGNNKSPNSKIGKRVCGLQHFNPKGEFLFISRTDRKQLSLISKIWNKILYINSNNKPYYLKQTIIEPKSNYFIFDQNIYNQKIRGNVKIFGYWQSEKYFTDVADSIRREITVKKDLCGKNSMMAHTIQSTNSVAIHVRHGDNANSVAIGHGMLPMVYYRKSIKNLKKELNAPNFFVFSDDIPWAKQEFTFDVPITFVEHNNELNDYEDLRLMSLCNHYIIANSSFSWWGAWLGKKEEQIVYAPKRYYQNIDRPNPDLFPESWRII